MHDPFLVDECLTPDLVGLAHARGHAATHVVHRGLAGASDRDIASVTVREGLVLVTNNGRDFLRIYARESVHPGLVVIVPGGMVAEAQIRHFGLALDLIDGLGDLVNMVVEVFADGRGEVRNWPDATI